MTTIAIGVDLACLAHETGPRHPERAERLAAVAAAIAAAEQRGLPTFRLPERLASPGELGLIHPDRHIRTVEAAAARGQPLDVDTRLSAFSYEAGRRAAGLALEAVDALLDGRAKRAFLATRPPGHHALADRAMGFCLFNSIAIAAQHARAHWGLRRVAIVDFDVHHGNGTQAIFETDPDTLFVSSHQLPGYPGSGNASELGLGAGRGATLNCPVPSGTGDEVLAAFYEQVVPRVLDAFAPELILVSAGFDLMAGDPLADLSVSASGVARLTRSLVAAADRTAGGRIAFFLEGGYDLENLRSGATAVLDVAAEAPPGGPLAPWSPHPALDANLRVWRGAITI